MAEQHYVYWYHLREHTNVTLEGYVGVTVDLSKRHMQHSMHKQRCVSKLRNAFKKYGEDRIIRTIIKVCNTKEEAYTFEEMLRPEKNIGWNLTVGGGAPPDCTGRKHSAETKRKMSINNARIWLGKESPYKGQTDRFSDKTRALIGSYHKGKTISEGHICSMTKKLRGANSVMAKEVHLVHKDDPTKVHTFGSISDAARELNLNYSRVRSLYQRAQKEQRVTGRDWYCLCDHHKSNPVKAIKKSLEVTSSRRSVIYRPKGADNHKSREVVLENIQGKVKIFPSLLQAAQYVKLSEATLRYHLAQAKKRRKDANFTSVGWKVKYIEVQG